MQADAARYAPTTMPVTAANWVYCSTLISWIASPLPQQGHRPNAGEVPRVVDGLLDDESGIPIREHATNIAGAIDHVFGSSCFA